MNRLIIKTILLLAILFLGKTLLPGYCEEEIFSHLTISTKFIKGKVTVRSYVSSTITVLEEGKEKGVVILITDKTKVLRSRAHDSYTGSTVDTLVSANDIMQGDEVIVEYFDNPKASGPSSARSIELVNK